MTSPIDTIRFSSKTSDNNNNGDDDSYPTSLLVTPQLTRVVRENSIERSDNKNQHDHQYHHRPLTPSPVTLDDGGSIVVNNQHQQQNRSPFASSSTNSNYIMDDNNDNNNTDRDNNDGIVSCNSSFDKIIINGTSSKTSSFAVESLFGDTKEETDAPNHNQIENFKFNQNVYRHPDATLTSVTPSKTLNKYHFIGAGLSIGASFWLSKNSFNFFLPTTTTTTSSSSSAISTYASSFLKNSLLFSAVTTSVWSSFLWTRWMFFMYPRQAQNEHLKLERKVSSSSSSSTLLDPRLTLSATQMAQDLRDGKYTSVEICKLCIEQIEKYDEKHINAVTFKRYRTALEEAVTADKKLKEWRRNNNNNNNKQYDLPPFLGVPCTVKEAFHVFDAPSTSGHPARIGNIIRKDDEHNQQQAPVVTRYQNAGFVIICTTTTSELCMFIESYSDEKIFGTTCNPYDVYRGVGGSTGGEAAAISALYAPCGIGGDFGGSLRIPSAFNGIFTHKPSTRLIPNQGQYPSPRTLGNLMTCSGPMARNVEDLYPLICIMQNGGNNLHRRDTEVEYTIPLDEEEKKFCDEFPACPQVPTNSFLTLPPIKDVKQITLFVTEDLNLPFVKVEDEIKQAVRTVCENYSKKTGCRILYVDLKKSEEDTPESMRLAAHGSTVCPRGWKNFSRAIEMWAACGGADPVKYVDLLKNNQQTSTTDASCKNSSYDYASVPGELLKWLLGVSNHTFPSIALSVIESLIHHFEDPEQDKKLINLARDLTKIVGDETLGENSVLVCPTYPRIAPQHHSLQMLSVDFSYCSLFNALQLPSSQVPVWLHDEDQNQKLPYGIQIISKWGNDLLSLQMANEFASKTPFVHHRVVDWMK